MSRNDNKITITPVTTRRLQPPQDDLFSVLAESLPQINNGEIVVITSKVVSIHLGLSHNAAITDKKQLICQEADYMVEAEFDNIWNVTLTENTLLPAAGIDASNADGYYLTLPKQSSLFAEQVWRWISDRDKVDNFGVLITDSHSVPLRYGTIGVAIGFYGFEPVYNLKGKKDLFNRELEVSRVNVPDSLAASAVYAMGESDECTPLCIIQGADQIRFVEHHTYQDFFIPPKDDMYWPLLKKIYE